MLHGNGVWRMIKNENEPFTLLRFILSDVAATPMNWSCDEKKLMVCVSKELFCCLLYGPYLSRVLFSEGAVGAAAPADFEED